MSAPATEDELDALEARIDAWAARELADNPVVAAVERAPRRDGRRWFVRVHGEEKDVFTLRLTLGQRMLHAETHVLPAPEEGQAALYEQLLRRNRGFAGLAFSIGDEDALYLKGELPVAAVTDDELDRLLGSTYAYVEQSFRPALRIGFASRLRR